MENESKYVRVDPREHVLLRPDLYVGSNVKVKEEQFVLVDGPKIEKKVVTYVPAFLKIFDEVRRSSINDVTQFLTINSPPPLIVTPFSTLLLSQNLWNPSLLKPWRHLWTTSKSFFSNRQFWRWRHLLWHSCTFCDVCLFQILLNACDNKYRDPSMSEISVEIISGDVNLIQVILTVCFIYFDQSKLLIGSLNFSKFNSFLIDNLERFYKIKDLGTTCSYIVVCFPEYYFYFLRYCIALLLN